jgi:transcriptional regulator with XRE-family HTH domain
MSEADRVAELRRFLRERRARVRPDDVGLTTTGRRRVVGLRREEVAALAGIGVSWYTALENGDAHGVSESTLLAVATALRLSDSERQYLAALAAPAQTDPRPVAPDPLVVATMEAIAFPAYIITPTWTVLACNEAFRRVWSIREDELPFNAVERLFLEPAARTMHGAHFTDNVRPVIAMLHSSLGRQANAPELRALRDRITMDDSLRAIWAEYEISNPLLPNACTIDSPFGRFHYETLTLPIANAAHGIVVQVPDAPSRERLTAAAASPAAE